MQGKAASGGLEAVKAKFPVGALVELNSGGPTMSVVQYHERSGTITVRCQWFSGKKLESGEFVPETLRSVPEPDDEK